MSQLPFSQNDKPSKTLGVAIPDKVLSRFLALEQRVLLDAAAIETADQILHDVVHDLPASHVSSDGLIDVLTEGSLPVGSLPQAGGAREVLFIDAGIQDFESLIQNVGANVEVHVLQGSNWDVQIQSVLGRRQGDVDAIHLVSHGSAGRLVIGGQTIDEATLSQYNKAWSAIQQALVAGGDLLIYGCDVAAGESGHAFVDALASRTGADIAASEDLSGVSSLGGNWDFELQTGEITTRSLFADGGDQGFLGVLADEWVQDTEITAGTSSVAITHTAQGDFKFIGTSNAGPNSHGKVDVYKRDEVTGNWVLFQTLDHTTDGGSNPVGSIKAQFGYSIAAAGNKLVVSAPAFDPSTANASDGRVYVFTWNGATWATGVQRIDYIPIQGSGRTGFNGGSSDINDSRGTADQWGYSVDIATDGNGNYRLVIGNPYEDWWEYDNDDNGSDWGGSAVTRNERDDVGAAVVLQATNNGSFGTAYNQITQMYGWTSLTTDNLYFGSATAVGYGGDAGHWWVAVGGSGLDKVRVYLDPAAGTTINGTGHNQEFNYTGSSPNNITMDDDWMVIGNAASLQAYKLTGTTWAAAGSAFGGANAVVFIADRDYSWQNPTGLAPILVYSGVASDSNIYTYTAIWNPDISQFEPTDLINEGRQEVAVAIDRYRALDILVANSTGAQSWHYNWDPIGVNDTVTGNEDAAFSKNVTANDLDKNRDDYGVFGDAITIQAVSDSIYGATITISGGVVTYNPLSSDYLQTLAVGQTAQETLLVTIKDGQGGIGFSNLVVTIEGRNDAPVTTGVLPIVPFRTQQSGSTVSYDLSAYFKDVDQGESAALKPDVLSLPSGWSYSIDGTLLLVTIPSSAGHNTTGTVRVRMIDAQGAFSPALDFVIKVDAANDAPVVQTAIPDQVALVSNIFNLQLPDATFHDPDPAPFDQLAWTATLANGNPLPAWLSFNEETHIFTGTPDASDVGSFSIKVTVTDKGNLTASDTFELVIVNPSLKEVTQIFDGDGSNADFGFSTAISQDGNWMLVGSPGWNNGRGEVRYYQWSGSAWAYRGRVVASDGVANDRFGWSVAISDNGNKIIVGARNADNGAGAAYVYSLSGTTYGTQLKYIATARQQNDYFGTSVAMNESGSFVVIGASHYDANGVVDSGAVFRAATTAGGTLLVNVLPKDPHPFDRFGTSVAYDQNIIVVSAIGVDNASGIVANLVFNESDGIYASAAIGGIGGTLGANTGFDIDPVRGSVVKFIDGSSVINMDAPIDLGDSWTISAWYNGIQSGGAWRTLTRGSIDHQIIIQENTNVLGVYNNAGGVFVTSGYTLTAAQLSGWHNIVAVGENNKTVFYIDGVKVGEANFQSKSDIVAVGNYQGLGQKFANMLDDFRVYNRALTQTEIRNIFTGVALADGQYSDMGAVYVFSTDIANQQVAKLYAPDGHGQDMLGWSVSVDIYNIGGTRMSGVIAASAIYNDQVATDGGAVYIWRSDDLQTGGSGINYQNNGENGNGTWDLETKLVSYDVKSNDYFGYSIALDVDESTGAARMAVGTPFESSNGAYSGAVYAYKYQSGVWVPEKYVDINPQGGSQATAAFFGNAVAVAVNGSMARAIFSSRWKDTGLETNDGAIYSVNLLAGNYSTMMMVTIPSFEAFSAPAAFAFDDAETLGNVSFDEDGVLRYSPGESFRSLGAGETATDSFTYYTQSNGVIYENEVVVTIEGQNYAPEANNDVMYVSVDGSAILDVLANDSAGLVLQSIESTGVTGSLRIENNQLVYDSQGGFSYLRTGEAVQQSFTYIAQDSNGYSVTGKVTLVIVGTDRWPTAVNDVATVNADGDITVDVAANDREGSSESIWLSGLDTSGSQGYFSYEGNGIIRYMPGEAFASLLIGETATDTVVYTLRDAFGHESSGMLVVTVHGTNDGTVVVEPSLPVAHDDIAVTKGAAPVVVNVLENDGGGYVVSVTAGQYGQAVILADGTILYEPLQDMAALPLGSVVVDSFVYTVQYDDGRMESATVRVHINGNHFIPVEQRDDKWRENLVIVSAVGSGESYTPLVVPILSDSGISAALPENTVAEQALDGLLDMVSDDEIISPDAMLLPDDSVQGQGIQEEPAQDDATQDGGAQEGKLGLSAQLNREVLARQSDLEALLKQLESLAA